MEDAQAHKLTTKIKANMIAATKARKSVEVSALRSLLARISNAEAVPADQSHIASSSIAGASVGVGSTEAPRKQLSYMDVQEIIQAEIQEIQAAKQRLDGSSDYVAELDQKIVIVSAYLEK
ncbi:MAG TPA: hypothetical protein VMT30_03165 [Candidatus Saccharimonadia bacterium]|nr:hypothetical protein [Candidatus Saccharimonadia bacterium]